MNALTEDEQLDNLKSFTKKYGSAAVSGVLIALIAFFGWNYWQNKKHHRLQNETARVQQLIDQAQSAAGDTKAYTQLAPIADTVFKKAPDSAQAIQAQFVMAKVAFDQGNYAAAERELKKVQASKVDDEGLLQLVNLRLAYAQTAQKKYDDALKTLDLVTVDAFKASADEARGDIFVAKNDMANAKKVYQSAWDATIARKQERQILQIKLESVGVLVDDQNIERPILKTQVDES
ncbi:YfgM family protein [Acinetobacter sp. MD2(2019)]|uniref:YfgM family protein n=1 Tax=Acinetobacter sp. MD2(2019) TaxID=2605273 RepID=UPI002D1EF983|nr:tetratricopeptide repeat protein [Acinetobacter sp. MD2(2019)]MEB3753597.1 tetratricopeptide repeat protein [Acinetobacter sp. MD2(2019)]